MFSSRDFKLIIKPRSFSCNCSNDIKEKVFFVTKNNLASEKKNRANKFREKSFFIAVEVDSKTVWFVK